MHHDSLDRRFLLGGLAGVAGAAALASIARGGPISPPSGPVGPTGKTLNDVEPRTPLSDAATPGDATSVFRITSPGSYYLTANLVVPAGRNGIKIGASGVAIDLNGFTISNAAAGAVAGVTTENSTVERITIRNGFISGMTAGVSMPTNAGVVMENLIVDACTNDGVAVGDRSTTIGCAATRCGRYGFAHAEGAIVVNCVARDNGAAQSGDGFSINPIATDASVYTNCVAEGNNRIGFHGFGSVTFENCVARANGLDGFFVGQEAIVAHNCIARGNGGDGFFSVNGVIEACVASGNAGSGINLSGGVVRDCRAVSNPTGITAGGSTVVAGNHVATTNGVGISVSGSGARIEGNHVVGGTTGISVGNVRNVIINNTVRSAATPFSIVANNIYGAISDRSTASTSSVTGAAAPSSAGTTDPLANIVC